MKDGVFRRLGDRDESIFCLFHVNGRGDHQRKDLETMPTRDKREVSSTSLGIPQQYMRRRDT